MYVKAGLGAAPAPAGRVYNQTDFRLQCAVVKGCRGIFPGGRYM